MARRRERGQRPGAALVGVAHAGSGRPHSARCFPQNSTLTIEEFHAKLQEATNFPLRPFVIPFLKVSRPTAAARRPLPQAALPASAQACSRPPGDSAAGADSC